MKRMKIVDYVVVNCDNKKAAPLSERIELRISEIHKEIERNQKQIEGSKERLERYEFLDSEYRKYESGQTYTPLSKEEEREWSNKANKNKAHSEGSIYHPLNSLKSVDGKVTLDLSGADKQYLSTSYQSSKSQITGNLSFLQDSFNKNTIAINNLQQELIELESDTDPTTNKNTRTDFEAQVFELIEKGYEPQGGISVSYGKSYQAMVRYEN